MFPEWACAALFVSAFPSLGADDESLKSQAPVADEAIAQSAPNAYRILFIGDSITRHNTNPDILARLGWDHIAGMAASSEDKDYVHLLAAKIQGMIAPPGIRMRPTGRIKIAQNSFQFGLRFRT